MPVFTIVVTGADGHQHTTLSEFRDERTAISDTQHVVTPEHVSVALARGVGADVEFLGAWDWDGSQARWTPEE